jgi:hypothetical protein
MEAAMFNPTQVVIDAFVEQLQEKLWGGGGGGYGTFIVLRS